MPKITMGWRQNPASIVMPCMLVGLAVACYANTLPAAFLDSWDDGTYVTDNPLIRDLRPAGLWRMWSQFYFWQYIPMTLTSYALDYQLWGLRPGGYHLTNVLLHACNGVLVYWLGCRLQASWRVAGLAATLFVVHPVQVETVAWIAERKNLLSLFFFLWALLAYIRSRSVETARVAPWLAWGCYGLAVLSKPIVVAGPLLFMAYDVLWSGDPVARSMRRHLPFLILGLLGGVLTVLGGQGSDSMKGYWGGSPWRTAQIMLRICWEYLVVLVLPLRLNNLYLYTVEMLRGDVRVWLGGGVLALTGLCAWRQPFGKPLSAFAMLWVWVFFLPVANLVPFSVLRADRYLYFPAIMLCLLFGTLVQRLWHRQALPSARRAVAGGLVVGLVLLGWLTIWRNEVWRTSETLWRDHLQEYPQSAKGLLNLGVYHYHRQEYAPAEPLLRRLVAVAPQHVEGYRYLASSLAALDRRDAALMVYEQALQVRPQEKKLYNDLGYTYFTLGRYHDAVSSYKAALALDPHYSLAQLNLGQATLRLRDYAQARDVFTAMLHQTPDHAGAVGGLCQTLYALDELEAAQASCHRAVRLQPDNGQYLVALARILLRLRQPEAALGTAQQAVRAMPQASLSHRLLGDVYAALGEIMPAISAYQAALQLDPTDHLLQRRLEQLQRRRP